MPIEYRFEDLDLREEPSRDGERENEDSNSMGPECGPLRSRFRTCTC